jgi:hypothetical protein
MDFKKAANSRAQRTNWLLCSIEYTQTWLYIGCPCFYNMDNRRELKG